LFVTRKHKVNSQGETNTKKQKTLKKKTPKKKKALAEASAPPAKVIKKLADYLKD
jgi:hypothetical protein